MSGPTRPSNPAEVAALVVDAVSGDRIALQVLIATYAPLVTAYVHRLMPRELWGRMGPEDVAQDACLEASRRIAGFRPEGEDAFRRWLFTIARNRLTAVTAAARRQKRGGGRERVLADGAGDVLGHDPDGDVVRLLETLAVYYRTPSQSAARRELVVVLERCIDELASDQREAVRLRHLEGLDVATAAARMSRSEPAFKMLCSRGLRQLQTALRSRSFYV